MNTNMSYYDDLVKNSPLSDQYGNKFIISTKMEVINRSGIYDNVDPPSNVRTQEKDVYALFVDNTSCFCEKLISNGGPAGRGKCCQEVSKSLSDSTMYEMEKAFRSVKGHEIRCNKTKVVLIIYENPIKDSFDMESAVLNLVKAIENFYKGFNRTDTLSEIFSLIWKGNFTWETPRELSSKQMNLRKKLSDRLDIFYKMGYTLGKEVVDLNDRETVFKFYNALINQAELVKKEYIASTTKGFER